MRFGLGKHFTIFQVWMPSHDHFPGGTVFSLWGLVLARTKPHRLKSVSLKPHRYFSALAAGFSGGYFTSAPPSDS